MPAIIEDAKGQRDSLIALDGFLWEIAEVLRPGPGQPVKLVLVDVADPTRRLKVRRQYVLEHAKLIRAAADREPASTPGLTADQLIAEAQAARAAAGFTPAPRRRAGVATPRGETHGPHHRPLRLDP